MSEKLHNALVENGTYTKSYEEFVSQFSTTEKQDELYKTLNASGDYSKSKEDFKNQFFTTVEKEETTAPEVKEDLTSEDTTVKEESTVSESLGGTLASEKSKVKLSEIDKKNDMALLPERYDLNGELKPEYEMYTDSKGIARSRNVREKTDTSTGSKDFRFEYDNTLDKVNQVVGMINTISEKDEEVKGLLKSRGPNADILDVIEEVQKRRYKDITSGMSEKEISDMLVMLKEKKGINISTTGAYMLPEVEVAEKAGAEKRVEQQSYMGNIVDVDIINTNEETINIERSKEIRTLLANIDFDNDEVTEAIAKMYFDFSGIQGYNPSASDIQGGRNDKMIRENLPPEKYEQWKRWQENKELPMYSTIIGDPVDGKAFGITEDIIQNAIFEVKDKVVQTYFEGLSTKERFDVMKHIPTATSEINSWKDYHKARRKDEEDFLKKYGYALSHTQKGPSNMDDRIYTPVNDSGVDWAKHYSKSANQSSEDYIKKMADKITGDDKKLALEIKAYKELNGDFITGIEKLNDELSDLNGGKPVTSDSPPDVIDAFNTIVGELKVLKRTIADRGLSGIYENLSRRSEKLKADIDGLTEVAKVNGDLRIINYAAGLNYSGIDRTIGTLEKDLLNPLLVTGADAVDFLSKDKKLVLGSKARKLAIKTEEDFEDTFSKALSFSWQNLDIWLPQALANNSASIAAVGGFFINPALGYSLFFGMGYGHKVTNITRNRFMADKQIGIIDSKLKEAVTEDRRLSLIKQKDDWRRKQQIGHWQERFSGILAGGSEVIWERLGSVNAIKNFSRWSRVVGRGTMKKAMGVGYGITLTQTVELGEELFTQFTNNIFDNIVLGEKKSIGDGVNKDFFANVIVTGLALQSRSIGQTTFNLVSDQVRTRDQKKLNAERLQRIFQIDKTLQNPLTLDSIQVEKLVNEKMDLIEQAGIETVMNIDNLNNLTFEEKQVVFEKARQAQEVLSELETLGASGDVTSNYAKKNKKFLMNKYNELVGEKDQIIDKKGKEIRQRAKNSNNPAAAAYNAGFNNFATNLARYNAEKNGKQFTQINDITNLKQNEELFDDYQEILEAYENGDYAFHAESGNVYVFQENVDNQIYGTVTENTVTGEKVYSDNNTLEAMIAAVSPIHENLHDRNRTVGIIKDGKVVESAIEAIEGVEAEMQALLDANRITQEVFDLFKARKDLYTDENTGQVDMEELINLVGDLHFIGALPISSFNNLFGLKSLLNNAASYFFEESAPMFKFKTKDVFGYVQSFYKQSKSRKLKLSTRVTDDKKAISLSKSTYDQFSPEELVEIIKDPLYNETQTIAAENSLTKQFDLLALDALKYDTRKGDIAREEVIAAAREYLPGIINRFNPESAKFSTFVNGNIAPKQAVIYEEAKSLSFETVSLDAPQAQQLADETTEVESNLTEDKITKVNVLQVGKIASKQDGIRKATKVKKGDTHKQITDNNKGNVGSVIFNIPANKIANPKDNITTSNKIVNPKTGKPVKKGETGIPERSEATNIQDHFSDINTAKNFIKILNPTNVSEKDADINKIGENIQVSRGVYGRAIGLPNRILDYFYNKKFKPDGKRARSQGLTSQVGLWELKPEFKNLNDAKLTKAAKQFQKDLGITEQQEVNKLPTKENRSIIGQLLKGAAVVTSMQVSLSSAQRRLAAFPTLARRGAKKAKAQEIADVTAGQSKLAFSRATPVTAKAQKLARYVSETIKANYVKNKLKALGQENIPKGELFLETTENGEVIEVKEYSARLMQTLVPGQKYTWETSLSNAIASFLNEYPQYYNMLKLSFTGSITRTAYGAQPNFEQNIKEALNNIGKKSLKEIQNTEQVDAKRNYYNIALTKDQKKKGLKGKRQRADIGTRDDSIDQNKVKNLIDFYKNMGQHLKSNKKDTWMLQEFILHGSMDQNNFGRMSAFFLGYAVNNDGKAILNEEVVEEHSPQAEVMRMLAGAAIDNRVEEVAPLVESLFSQMSILEKDDPGGSLKSSNGVDFFNKVAPQIINGNLSWLPKGYASTYRLMKAGVDPNSYILKPEKQTIAQYFGVDNLNVEKARQSIIEIFEGIQDINVLRAQSKINFSKNIDNHNKLNKAIMFSRANKIPKGITVLDFDDTLATSKSLIRFTKPDGTKGTLNAEQYAKTYEELTDLGYKWDFSEFNKVVSGKTAPLFQKALKLQGKFGSENMFVLTARPPQSAKAIFEFLQANGLNIPLKNITGLANSTSEAKALWMADKVADGYNDFYFADDALQNVQAVKNMLDQFDVKSKVQQARVKFSKNIDTEFNNILENVTGIESDKRFSAVKGRKRGESKGKFRVFVPPSHEDFVGLLYNFLGKGKEGNAHRDFFEQALIRPLNRANRELDTARQSVANDYKALNKQFENVRNKLAKKTPDGDFTFQDAIRVYLWSKHGHKIPGLTKTDQTKLTELVMSDTQLQAYAETLNVISKQETYVNPTEGWNSGDIRMDLDDATGRIGRGQYFAEFIENAGIIFSEENLNKIEAGYGKGVRESLEDMLYRIETGRNRPSGQNEQVNKLMNYLNGSVGTVMFFNMRSALLQQMSIVNYINFADNNIFAAAKAFANQPQYWADWSFIFNSDMLKQRRGGIQTDVNGAELAASLRNSKDISRKLVSKLLELGFLPTQIGDNIAIATGGATYYRNRINKYVKQGMPQKEAEAAAFTDFQDITQATQQSARPDMVSKQQASVIGKVILNFQNVTSQFNRLGKKAFQDIYNRRITKPNTTQMQSDISNAARITYYFAVQNAIFYTLQTALFAMMFDDDEEDNNKLFLKKRERLINGSIDSVLRGSGLIGGIVATLKNVAIAWYRQRDARYNPDESAVLLEALNLSPVLGIKGRKITNAEKTLNYNKSIIEEMETFDIDNPMWSAVTNHVEWLTNIPLNRLYNKTQNVRQSLNNDHAAWERALMFFGWSQYNLDLENKKMDEVKESVKEKKKTQSKEKSEEKKRTKLREDYPNKSDKEINNIIELKEKNKEVFNLNKSEQVKILEANNLNPKDYPKEKDRVDAIMNLRLENEDKIDSTLTAIKNYVPTKDEKISIELFKMNKKDQANLLMELGVSTKVIKSLKYEEDRVKKIIELQRKVKKQKNK